ncbi:unnamed protein product [Fraxinus pennsylvanica]|uniref:HHO5-like N-terminal domain-containing protein n=1 Tax=Fraxinus pennsylvanica TaxID=56036 RepID=A0AAD1Z5G0_9LAMI|nr:unnamed protein product [Fraxinus pennsylvanica]
MINSNNHSDYSDKMQKCQDYIHALQEEHKKIQVFQRELPLCLELVTRAIEACKQQLSGTSTEYNLHGESECSEQISSEGPILEEFIPIKRALSTSDYDDEEKSQKPNNKNSKNTDEKSSKKSDWLRSVGLWNQTPDPTPEEVDGLTNDEVKSHLQKYRLHTRRSPNHSIHGNNNPQQPQFVVVGGIWVPPPEYAAMATTSASGEASGVSTTSNRIYTPIAKLPPPFPGASTSPKQRQQHSDDRGSHSEGGDFHSHSPAGSCSTHTTNTLSTH